MMRSSTPSAALVGVLSQFGGRSIGGGNAAAQIAAWVQQTFTATTVDGITLYDLTRTT